MKVHHGATGLSEASRGIGATVVVCKQRIRIRAEDGAECEAVCFSDRIGSSRGLVVCTPAMGVRATHYDGLASELARRGLVVLVYDLRGIGSSSVRARRGVNFGYHNFIALDLPAVLTAARELYPSLPIVLLGHSIGGHISAMYASIHPNDIRGLVLIGTGTSHLRNWPVPYRVGILAMAQLTRVVTRLLGYFPGRCFGFFGTEASHLMDEWRTLTMTGEFRVIGSRFNFEERLPEVELPVLSLSLAGDVFAPPRAVTHFNGKMRRSAISYHHLEPSHLGAAFLDHFRWAKHPIPIANLVSAWLCAEDALLQRNGDAS